MDHTAFDRIIHLHAEFLDLTIVFHCPGMNKRILQTLEEVVEIAATPVGRITLHLEPKIAFEFLTTS